MHLSPRDRLGPYEIVSLVGAGGMGEVYRARDTRLDRTVAIKVLPAHIENPSARERFEQEARAVSSLNHPNICTLYDIGSQDGRTYLVMEYLEGETLSHRLARGPLPLEKILEYGIQIAAALDRAHRQGVIHRDLKPGNVMLTPSGAKLLDFGLAKMAALPLSIVPSDESTRTVTVEGTLLGTCQYLAPELLEGKEPDARVDIFAFGAVLYEMLAGRRAFQGETQAVIIAKILEHDPPPLPATAGTGSQRAALEHLVWTCLAKDPVQRRQSAHDIVLELEWIARGEIRQPPVARRGLRAVAGAAVLLLAIAALALLWTRRQERSDPRMLRVSVLPPDKAAFAGGSLPALSPDGRRLVFAAAVPNESGRKTQLWVRDLETASVSALAGTEEAGNPFWSPASDAVAFFAYGKLQKVRLSGGPPEVLASAMQGRGGTWGGHAANGIVVFAPSTLDPLYRVPAGGGAAAPVTALDRSRGEVSHRWPWFLPDGRHFLYTARNSDPRLTAVCVGDLESKDTRRLLAVASNAVYAPPGYLLFARGRTLMAQSFDAARIQTKAEPFPIADQVDLIAANVQGNFSASNTGMVAYYSGATGLNSALAWFDRTGKKMGVVGEPGSFVQPAVSPDGARLAVDRLDPQTGTYDLWLYDLARGVSSRLTFDPQVDGYPVWSPDGRRLVFSSNRNGTYNLYQKTIGSAEHEELLLDSPQAKFPTDWSRDGRYLVYSQVDARTKYDIWVLSLADHKAFPFLATEFNEYRARLSPDGRWLAYASDETSRDEVYVQTFPPPGAKWKVSVNGGTRPMWSRDGKELFYIGPDRKLMAARVKAGARFETAAPQPLFQTRISTTRLYDVSPDGRRFLLVDPIPETAPPAVNLLVNWPAAARR